MPWKVYFIQLILTSRPNRVTYQWREKKECFTWTNDINILELQQEKDSVVNAANREDLPVLQPGQRMLIHPTNTPWGNFKNNHVIYQWKEEGMFYKNQWCKYSRGVPIIFYMFLENVILLIVSWQALRSSVKEGSPVLQLGRECSWWKQELRCCDLRAAFCWQRRFQWRQHRFRQVQVHSWSFPKQRGCLSLVYRKATTALEWHCVRKDSEPFPVSNDTAFTNLLALDWRGGHFTI